VIAAVAALAALLAKFEVDIERLDIDPDERDKSP
jgi:hypothetical protein